MLGHGLGIVQPAGKRFRALRLMQAKRRSRFRILFTNVNIFDGFKDKLSPGMSVLVEDNYIKEVGKVHQGPGCLRR